jgi:hypothetical protein
VPNEHLVTETEMYDGWQGPSHHYYHRHPRT